jgi:DNA-binding transcriptional MerR regulator
MLGTPHPAPELPPIPAKRYFTIGEVSELCAVKPHVLRYWEQEFSQLKPLKRRGNRRYYQHHEVLLIRRIRGLLYDQGFTISGARGQLEDITVTGKTASPPPTQNGQLAAAPLPPAKVPIERAKLRDELREILGILKPR